MSARIEKLRAVYAHREAAAGSRYSLAQPAALLEYQHRVAALAEVLRECAPSLKGLRILEVGCGYGQWLVDLETLGADRPNLAGVDAIPERVARCAARLNGADIRQGDAEALPWQDGVFDVVLQGTMLSSVQGNESRRKVAAEMARVLSPSGVILSYDLGWNNPRNPDVRRVTPADLE